VSAIREIVRRHRSGERVGIYSVCSAHPLVIRAALEQALAEDGTAFIEATSNQVNQDGGYTGLRPADFRDLVAGIADEVGLARDRVLLGGDHLGPNCWQHEPARTALERSGVMVEGYVRAGFQKIHLDCSMPCRDDTRPLTDALIAERTAMLCARAEAAWKRESAGRGQAPVYIVGSEVPTPGGAQEALEHLAVTTPAAVEATLAAHRTAFERHGLEAAWERVVGLVVQPGVEFDDTHVIDYLPANARALRDSISAQTHLVFEAHSTDYQTPAALAALVEDHFAILKVGPALTFALREAVWALDAIEREWLGSEHSSGVRERLIGAARSDPRHWAKHYRSQGHELQLQLEYSLSDRIRYYWTAAPVRAALQRLIDAFQRAAPPLPLLKQYLPAAYAAIRNGELEPTAPRLITHHVRQVLDDYSAACNPRR